MFLVRKMHRFSWSLNFTLKLVDFLWDAWACNAGSRGKAFWSVLWGALNSLCWGSILGKLPWRADSSNLLIKPRAVRLYPCLPHLPPNLFLSGTTFSSQANYTDSTLLCTQIPPKYGTIALFWSCFLIFLFSDFTCIKKFWFGICRYGEYICRKD